MRLRKVYESRRKNIVPAGPVCKLAWWVGGFRTHDSLQMNAEK
jgi:hypothetical protein